MRDFFCDVGARSCDPDLSGE